jgi:hypothetical protein
VYLLHNPTIKTPAQIERLGQYGFFHTSGWKKCFLGL